MNDSGYIHMKHKPIVTIQLLLAIFGTFCLIIYFTNSYLYEWLSQDYVQLSIYLGLPTSVAWLPVVYRSGLELDLKNNRFREYHGTFGRKKDDWIEVDKNDYLSLVGVHETRRISGRFVMDTVDLPACKVFFLKDDWHIEIYKSKTKKAKKFANCFAGFFQIEINDLNKDQDISK